MKSIIITKRSKILFQIDYNYYRAQRILPDKNRIHMSCLDRAKSHFLNFSPF